jgi:hypothetical protein
MRACASAAKRGGALNSGGKEVCPKRIAAWFLMTALAFTTSRALILKEASSQQKKMTGFDLFCFRPTI